MESEPPGVDFPKESATDIVPVGLRIGDRRHSQVGGITADGPTGLRNPDLLAPHGSLGLLDGRLKQVSSRAYRVGHGVLEVRIGIHPDKITALDHSIVGAIHPRSPCVDVADGDLGKTSPADGLANLTDVASEGGWVGSETSLVFNPNDRVTV